MSGAMTIDNSRTAGVMANCLNTCELAAHQGTSSAATVMTLASQNRLLDMRRAAAPIATPTTVPIDLCTALLTTAEGFGVISMATVEAVQ